METDSNPSEVARGLAILGPLPMSPSPIRSWIPLMMPLLFLGAIALATAIVALRPDSILTWVGFGGAGLVLLWLAATTFWPARADRSCPQCGQETLERMDPATTMGLRCTRCSFEDDAASGWFLAEEEEPDLDSLVRRQRGK